MNPPCHPARPRVRLGHPVGMAATDALLAWIASRHHTLLVTIRSDGSPQTSNISDDPHDGIARVSVTSGWATTHNLRRDLREILHDPQELFAAMAEEERLVLALRVVSVVAQGLPDGPTPRASGCPHASCRSCLPPLC